MTSSMLAGERRWASARRGGMTVLGKVAVPKPINLPSQKLENHGLDPNVEIVPKGSLSWGSRPSSASNPWGSSPSPSGDCSSGSPSHVGGRPSSGGSGTRPSTAGSDRMHEPSPSAWGSNSRPSSASGTLTSNQTSLTPLRPQSAETRPSSSHLSRFAEHLPDSSVAWGPAGNVDKLTVASTKNDNFSLSSGDFPTLGTERENSGKKSGLQDYGSHDRPRSSSGEGAPANDGTVTSESSVNGGDTNTWKRDAASHPDDGVQPNSNNWQGGYPQQFMNTNVPPQHFDAWRGPSVNSPAGVWYGGPPYGPPVAPGGYPLEPFPYYRPHMPPPALGNSQPVPEQLPVAGPRGHHAKNGDLYRPQIPEPYMHPGMPVRPGFYPRPVPYDNYYGAPVRYCNPNERDIPYMGMSAGPPVFNRYPGQNIPDHSNTHIRAGGRGSNATSLIAEQVESGNSEDSRGPYKVLTKQHNHLDAYGEKGRWESNVPGDVSFPGKGGQPRATYQKNEWGADGRREEMQSRRTAPGEYSSSRKFGDGGRHSLNSARVKSPDYAKSVDQSWGKKSETAPSSFPEVPQVVAATPKDSTLLQKIEGLNAKARASDGHLEVPLASSREEQKTVSQYDTARSSTSTKEVGTPACSERPNSGGFVHVSSEAAVSRGYMIHQVGTSASRRAHDGEEGRVEHRGKGRIKTTDPDGWRKNYLGAEYFTAIPTTNVGPVSVLHNQDHHIHAEAVGTPETSLSGKDEGESLTLMLDSSDTQAQRAKMRELAKQRAIQLQREEEERIREQKAKALAKLEELNRRTMAGDGLTQNLEKTPVSGIVADQEDSQTLAEPIKIGPRNETSNVILDTSPRVAEPSSVGGTSVVAETIVLSKNSHMDTSKVAEQGTSSFQSSSLELLADSDSASASAGAVDVKSAPEINNISSSKHMPTGYKQNQSIQLEKPFTETLISFGTIGPNIHEILVVGTTSSETAPREIVPNDQSTSSDNANMVPELSATQRKKVTKPSKNKSKLEKPSSASQLQVTSQPSPDRGSTELGKFKASQKELDPGLVQSAEDLEQAKEQHSLLSDEPHLRVNTHLKSQPSRRVSKSAQSNKVTDRSPGNDATIWAPVRSHHKIEAVDEVDRKSLPDSATMTAESSNLGQRNPKGKRAEMERYVPKPVAKEHAQQGSTQLLVSSSVSQTTPNENTGRGSNFQKNESSQPSRSIVENAGRKLESNTGDSKQSREGKAHGGWKEHGSTESSRVQPGSYMSSNSSKNIHTYMDQQEPSILDANQAADPNFPNGWDPSDGWNMPEEPSPPAAISFGMKDQGGSKGKGKRHPYKSHKAMANKHDLDQKNSTGGEMYKKQIQSAAPETSQPERNVTVKESRGIGERAAPLWQPKSQSYSAYSTGSRSSGGQHVSAEIGRATRKDSPPEEYEGQLHLDQSVSRNKSVGEGRREKKGASGKERPQPHSHGLVDMDELTPPESGDTHFEHRSSSGFRKHGNQNNRPVKGRELREDWSSVGQDSRHQNVPVTRERQPRNSHYEYQPVGPYNHSSSNNFEGPIDGSHNMGSRYRERGQGQSRRGGGNSYGRKSGAVQVDAGYD